jgi:broad specificity phosphatase PhoE
MKFIKFLLIIFISINSPIKADSNQNVINELKRGGNIIFIRHAYAPGGGDPKNFDINDCKTQRNLSNSGRDQAKKIGSYFKKNNIPIGKVYSSEWCRCKETASIAFNDFETKSFLNSFFSSQFAKNKDRQMKKLKKFINNWNKNKNLVFVTHYVVISEIVNYAPSSGEIVISNANFKVIDTIEIEY